MPPPPPGKRGPPGLRGPSPPEMRPPAPMLPPRNPPAPNPPRCANPSATAASVSAPAAATARPMRSLRLRECLLPDMGMPPRCADVLPRQSPIPPVQKRNAGLEQAGIREKLQPLFGRLRADEAHDRLVLQLLRSEEHTSELQSRGLISYAVS